MTPEALAAVRKHVDKQADLGTIADAAQATRQQVLNSEALKMVGRIGLGTFGLGAGARGIMGVLNLVNRNTMPPKTKPLRPIMLDVPVPAEEEKQADLIPTAIKDFMAGSHAESISGLPWAMPAMVGAGAVGMYGGWKGMDAILDAQRKSQQQAEMEQAKKEYEAALLGQFGSKAAQSVSSGLDDIFDLLQTLPAEKRASLGNTAGWLTGVYGTVAGGAGILTALATYQAVKKRQESELLRKAQQRRSRSLSATRPAPIIARPVSVPGL